MPEIECPACGTANDVGAGFCPWCGLELSGSEAAALRALAAQIGEIDRELWETGERRTQLAAELASRRWTASRGATRPQPARPEPSDELLGRRLPHAPTPSPEWSVDRVRSVLLWVGAALLAASALTFTAVAWTHLGNGGRAMLLVAVTVISVGIALASAARLPATAEAFTALSIALALIDWQALRRAGVSGGISGSAWWTIGALVVSAFALLVGTAAGARTTRVAAAVLLPFSLELFVGTVAGAAWSFALGFALIAGAVAFAWRGVRRPPGETPVQVVLLTHALATWWIAVIVVLVATVQARTFAQALVPAAVALALAIAPAALLRPDLGDDSFTALATFVCAAPLGALVIGASTTFGGQALLAWATIVAVATVVVAPLLPRRWTVAASVAGMAFGAPGLVYGVTAALAAIFGPLAWLREPWDGSLGDRARTVFAGPHTTAVWRFGWASVVALGASVFGIAVAGAPVRRGRARVSSEAATAALVTIAALAACLVPVVSGASAGVACATTTGVLSLLVAAAAGLDRAQPRMAIIVLSIAVLPAVAAAGWAALTPTASIVVLAVGGAVLIVSTAVAVSDAVRALLGGLAGAGVIALAGVATASASRPAVAGFAIAIAAGAVTLAGVHGRWRAPEGAALEIVGVVGLVVGAAVAAQQTRWLAGTLTAIVPLLLVAGLRKERAPVYLMGAGAAAVGATWAWLAAAHVTMAEAYTAPAAVVALAVGLLAWRRGPARSWLALGPAIVLGLGPTLVIGLARDDTKRTLAAAVVAAVVLLFGAVLRLQAPLVLGTVALLTLAVDTFGPAVVRLPRWLPLAVIGVLLMWVGATFEKRRDDAERATRSLLQFG